MATKGIHIVVNGEKRTIYFECVLVVGDNLALNELCGFSGSFIANQYCRICSATKTECQKMIVEDNSRIRTVSSYDSDVSRNNYMVTGIKSECLFNGVGKFHIA